MPIDQELLDILCCPETRKDLKILEPTRITKLNKQITKGGIKYKSGKPVDKPLEEALITVDDTVIYRIDDEIPIMLIDMAIPAEQFKAF